MIRRRVVITGRVQGVFFRDSCRTEAMNHAVTGWVANRADGAVEVVFEGEPSAVETLVAWCRHGPSEAGVHEVTVTAEQPRSERGFRVR